MEKLDFNPKDQTARFDNDLIWQDDFMGHGIEPRHLKAWFCNYECKDEGIKKTLERLKVLARRNIPIALLGDLGLGKTHLATAILKDAVICSQRKKTNDAHSKNSDPYGEYDYTPKKYVYAGHYYTMTDLFRQYREAVTGDGNESGFMHNLFTMSCLVIDEFQIRSDSEAERRFIQEILDKRYSKEKQTIFVGNLSKGSFEKAVGRRIIDRLEEMGWEALVFTGESYRSKK